MISSVQFGNSNATVAREAFVVPTLIDDLQRSIRILERGIAHEEQIAAVYDPTDSRYPIIARTLAKRSENLKATVASLQMRLGQLNMA